MEHPGHDGKNLFPRASDRFCILSPSAGFGVESSDVCSGVLSDTEMPVPTILQEQLRRSSKFVVRKRVVRASLNLTVLVDS